MMLFSTCSPFITLRPGGPAGPGGPGGPGGPSMNPVGKELPSSVVVKPLSPLSPFSPCKIHLI